MNAIPMLASEPWVERLGWTLIHFLWEGISIAVLYAGARWTLARRGPHARYLLACAALAAMMAAPVITWSAIRPRPAARHGVPEVHRAVRFASGPSLPPEVRSAVPDAPSAGFLPWVVIAWLAGAVCFWVRLAGGWILAARMRSARVSPATAEWQHSMGRLAARIGISRPVRLLVSAMVDTPMVVGWLRPVVLAPVGMLAGLPSEQVEMLLLHELAHIRRYDYLVNALQSVAEALLFYHPAVWWVSGHIRAERELCCDDAAVSAGGDVLTYARALAELESARPVHCHAAVAANGGSLADRIARLLGQPGPAPRSFGPGVLTSAVVLAAAVYGASCVMFAQQAPAPLAFDAASVKVNRSNQPGSHTHQTGSLLTMTNVSLKSCIVRAYGVPESRVFGPPWIDSERYDITAKEVTDGPHNQMALRLQTLLKDRFQLALHRETREGAVYDLVTTRSRLKMKKESDDAPHSGIDSDKLGQVTFTAVSMTQLVDWLGRPRQSLGRPVIDKTGLDGRYSFTLDWVVESNADDEGAAIMAALQDRTGLKLEPRKEPLEVLVVDHAEKVPVEN